MSDERDEERAESDDGPHGPPATEDDGRAVDRHVNGDGRAGDGDDDGCDGDDEVRVVVRHGDGETVTRAAVGTTLRDHLLDHGLSPYARLTERANCGGNGLCATCGVRIPAGEPDPTHWHDRLAARFGYPRLSCQIRIRGPMVVELVDDKRVWGGRE